MTAWTPIGAPLPAPRGPISAALLAALVRPPHEIAPVAPLAVGGPDPLVDPLADADLLLALHACYELHYRGFAGVDDGWEWEPSLLAFRAGLESRLEAGLRALVAPEPVEPADVPRALTDVVEADDGPALASYVQRKATLGQVRELLVHRSIYQLKEADPHTWAIPRLAGRPKAALVEVQTDEYGNGRPERMHSTLFATSMREVGLDDTYGAYTDLVPAVTLATSVVASYFGLHRRWRGAIAGHLAALEMTSSLPMRRYGNGLRRLGLGPAATRFFDEHVEADAVHEQVAAHDLCGALATAEPALTQDIVFGAAVCLALDARLATYLLGRWDESKSTLRDTLDPVAVSA
jgi:Iron-containing redox enzyme